MTGDAGTPYDGHVLTVWESLGSTSQSEISGRVPNEHRTGANRVVYSFQKRSDDYRMLKVEIRQDGRYVDGGFTNDPFGVFIVSAP